MRLSWVAFFAMFAAACEVGSATDAGDDDAGRRIDAARPHDAGRDSGPRIDSGGSDAGPMQRMVALDTMGRLLFFDPATPGEIDDVVQVTGMLSDEFLHGITIRPADGGLL